MKQQSELQPLLDALITKEDVAKMQQSLDQVIEKIYSTKVDVNKMLAEVFPREIKAVIVDLAEKKGVSIKDPVAFQNVLTAVKEQIRKISLIEISVGGVVTEEFLYKMQRWFDENIDNKVIIQIKQDPSIIGGAVISYNGKFHDYTVNAEVEKLLSTTT